MQMLATVNECVWGLVALRSVPVIIMDQGFLMGVKCGFGTGEQGALDHHRVSGLFSIMALRYILLTPNSRDLKTMAFVDTR